MTGTGCCEPVHVVFSPVNYSHRVFENMGKGRLVLLVEDDADLREFFKMCLRQGGYDVHVAADGMQALAFIDSVQPDLIVLDLRLPHVSGYDILDELEAHETTRKIPVVVVTGSTALPVNRNVSHSLRKPITGDRLTETVQRCLARRRGETDS